LAGDRVETRAAVPEALGPEAGFGPGGLTDRSLVEEELGLDLAPSASVDAVEEPWLRGYRMFESQRRFHDLRVRYKGFSGPVGSGKSMALCREALRLAYRNAGCVGLIAAPTYPMLRDVTRAAFLSMLETVGVPFRFIASENAVVLPEARAHVLFRSLDNPERVRGTNLAWFGVDELTYCKTEAWLRLEGRLRDPAATELCGFAAWTPKGFDWVWRRFISDERVAGYEAVRARPGENTALPADFYETLRRSYDERFYRQEALGEYLAIFSGRVYYAFDRGANVAAVEFDPRGGPLLWALDFNVGLMCSVLCQRQGETLVVLDEIVLPDSNTWEACEEFGERADRLRGALRAGGPLDVYVYGDASGAARSSGSDRTDWQIVREWFGRRAREYRASFRVPAANPTVRARVNAVNGLLCNQAGERRLIIAPHCRELIADLEQVAWRTDPSGNVLGQLDKSDPRRTHISDALGYLVEREFGLRPRGGVRAVGPM
jgi:hypothetical protein